MPRRRFDLLVCDLDDTLYDWVGYFVPAFYAMVDEAVAILNCDREALLDSLQAVHQRHHDSEHPFALLEADIVQKALPNKTQGERKAVLDSAFLAFNRTRKRTLKLHEAVEDTLAILESQGVRLVAHTESKTWSAIDRLTRLNIDGYFSRLYCRRRSLTNHPTPDRISERFKAFDGRLIELDPHERKPSPEILRTICADEDIKRNRTAYVGDSIARDVAMATKAGIFSIWAAYGCQHDPQDYERLVRITHWTPDDVAREKQLKADAANVKPDFVCERKFAELLAAVLDEPTRAVVG